MSLESKAAIEKKLDFTGVRKIDFSFYFIFYLIIKLTVGFKREIKFYLYGYKNFEIEILVKVYQWKRFRKEFGF